MDNFFRHWFGGKREAPAPVVTLTTDPNHPTNQQTNSGTYEEHIVRPQRPDAALTISAVYRAVELRAKTESQFQMQYQKLDRAGGNFTPDMWGLGKTLNYLLQVSPNPVMSAPVFFSQLVIDRLMLGNAIAYIQRDVYGDPVALWRATCGGYNALTGTYTLNWYGERGPVTKFQAPARDVIHIPNTYLSSDGYMGLPTIAYAIETLALIATQKQHSLETAAKGGRMKLLISEEKQGTIGLSGGLYSKQQMEDYAKHVQSKLYDNDVVALRGLDKVQSISMSAQDMQLMEMLGMGMDDVARFYGTPRPLLMMDSNSHYTTPTNATMEYMTRTIQPDIREIEDEFNRKLLSPDDFGRRRFHLCEQPLLRLDKETQAKVDEILLRTGVKTINELRNQYDLPAIEGGDVHYVSTNLAELGSEKLRMPKGTSETNREEASE